MIHRFLILLVDDDPSLGDIVTRAAVNSFPEATFVHVLNSNAAQLYINGLEGYGPKLVLLDLDLGESVTGIDFIEFLRTHPDARFLPVIMLTVNNVTELIKQSYQAGISAFTVKPFTFDEWKLYMSDLRAYWFKTATIPRVYFNKPANSTIVSTN